MLILPKIIPISCRENSNLSIMCKQIFLIHLMLCSVVGLWAQAGAKKVTNTFALTNVTVVQSPSETLEGATVIVKDGLIKAVGKNVKIPFDAKRIKADSMYVYAGFISGASHIGIPKIEKKEGESRGRRGRDPDVKDPGNPPNDKAGIQPERSVRDLLKAEDKSIAEMRKLGFTAAQVMPRGRMLPGKASLVFLAGDNANDMIAQEDIALFSQLLGANGRIYPSTVIGVMSKLRDLYHQAEQAKTHSEGYKKSSAGMRRPTSDPILEAFFPLIEGDQHLVMRAINAKDISRALALQKDLGYNLSLVEVKQAWDYADKLKDIPVMLSLDLPAAKKDDKKKKEAEEEEEKKELTEAEKEMEQLEARRAEAMKQYEKEAAMLASKGVVFGFSTMNAKAKDIRPNIKRMIDNGLSESQALAALTTVPAKMLGIDKVAGTVEKGKVANLVVSDAPYFGKDANVRYVFVDGQIFEYEAKPKKKKKAAGEGATPADAAAIKKIAGEWTYNINAMGQEMNGTLTLTHEDGEWNGVMSDPTGSGEDTDLNDVELDDQTVTFTIDNQGMTVEFELDFDGKNYTGTASVGAMGSFEIDGKRKPDNN